LHVHEGAPALVRLRIGKREILKSFPKGAGVAHIISAKTRDIALDMLALAKADVAPLYVSRPVLNADEVIRHFRRQGLSPMIGPEDMHVTIAYSREPVNWQAMGKGAQEVHIAPDHTRSLDAFGQDKSATVLKIRSPELQQRHQQFRRLGASWDWSEYAPHITLSYSKQDRDLRTISPYADRLLLGPERFEDIDLDKSFVEKAVARWSRRK
jgi:2'-5' RNA ligase